MQVRRREESFTTLHLNWSISDIDLRWFSGALDSQIKIDNDQDRTDIPAVVLLQEGHYGDNWDANQHELRVSGNAFDIWDWTVGGYYQEAKSQTDVSTFANRTEPVQGVFNVIVDIPLSTEIKALFTHNTIALTENTELTIGLRYNDFDHTDDTVLTGDFYLGAESIPGGGFTDNFILIEDAFPQQCIEGQSIPGTGRAPCAVGAGNFGWEEWTGTVKLSHFFSDELNTYITIDRGFRPGAPNFDVTGVFQPDLNFYEPEDVDSIEIGAKGDLFDGRARYTAAVFYNLYNDYQVPVNFEAYNTVTGAVQTITNAPFVNVDEAEQYGFEADFRMLVTDAWMIYGGFTYSKVEFTDGEIPCTDPSQPPVGPDNRFNTCDADGEVASAMPEWTGVLQTEYTWSQLVFDSDAYVNALWSYKGSTEGVGDTTGRLDGDSFAVLDLYAGLRNETWSAQIFAKNVLDDDGVLNRRPLDAAYNELTVTPPQAIGFTVSYNF
jgi:iron complex outermembrane receptor protein